MTSSNAHLICYKLASVQLLACVIAICGCLNLSDLGLKRLKPVGHLIGLSQCHNIPNHRLLISREVRGQACVKLWLFLLQSF